ncbi:MAG: PIG-L family deacetylase [Pirellulaceae bacterium]
MLRIVLSTALLLAIADLRAAWCDEPQRLDVLVVAPHSDDEAIGCTGVLLRAIAQQQRVGVVVVTAGDGFPRAAAAHAGKKPDELVAGDFVQLAALRQRHTLKAMERLGLEADDLMFLGFPDGGLATMYAAKDDEPYRQGYTGRSETYGVVVADYHRRVHRRAAPYVRASVLGDLMEILRARRPKEIYVTAATDTHSDHSAAYCFTRDAARAAGHRGPLWTFVVHGREPAAPPDRRVILTDAELKTKHTVLLGYQVGVSPVHDSLAETYTKPEERFWAAPLEEESPTGP